MRNKSTQAWAYVHAHPGDFLRLSATRVVCFWTGAGSELNSGIVELHAVVTSLLGLSGLAALWRRSKNTAMLFLLPLLVFPLPYYITHPNFRFRLLLDPLLTILSAYTAYRLKRLRKTSTRKPAEKRTSGTSGAESPHPLYFLRHG
jgi:hypothetical protein